MTLGGWFTRAASHLTGGLPLVPRGSKLTRSKRAATAAGTGLAFTRLRTPELPGPPGMRTRVPIRLAGSVALRRATATSMWSPPGRDQSTGTDSEAHSAGEVGRHGCQSRAGVVPAWGGGARAVMTGP